MATQTNLPFVATERTSRVIRFQFQDSDGNSVVNAALLTVVLTLYDQVTDTIINSRNDQDILGGSKTGANNVTIDGTGNLAWYMQPADNAIITVNSPGPERHIALIEWTSDPDDGNGVREDRVEIPILVQDLHRVP